MTVNKKVKTIVSVTVQILVFLIVLWGLKEWKAKDLIGKGTPAPDVTFAIIDGEKMDLSALKGSRVLLYFFSPYCKACKYTSRNIVALKENGTSSTVIIAVALSWDTVDDIRKYVSDNNLSVPVAAASDDIARRFRIGAYPTIYIIDDKGSVKDRMVGYTTEIGLRVRLL
ncbi:MAG TPA: redoxin domain-containing protein [Spirochaetota bacterium]|nr:redoxin domain-containing protein [Spirochaetota bacterium]